MASPFFIWSQLGPFFITLAGKVDGQDWAFSSVTDGGTPIWTETYTPSATYTPGVAADYTLVMTTQDFLGDIQPLVTVNIDASIVDPFGSSATAVGNLISPILFSNTSTSGSGGVLYWTKSTTANAYAVNFQPFTVTYPAAPTNTALAQLTGPAVTMIPAVINPRNFTFNSKTSDSMVFAYVSEDSNLTESLYMEGFNSSGVATNTGPVRITSGLALGTPFFIGYSNSTYGYRYLNLNGGVGRGLVSGTFDTTTGAIGNPVLALPLPTFNSFTGLESFALSSGNALRIVEGLVGSQGALEAFINSSPNPTAIFNLTSADDHFRSTAVYDPTTGNSDYVAIAYTDNGAVHLELLNENGVQIGSDTVVPGITSFDRIHGLTSSTESHSTRVEIDYTVADPAGGFQIQGLIYDTATAGKTFTLSGGGLRAGTTFGDTFTWGAGVYYLDGGGGDDTLAASSLSLANVSLRVDAAHEVILDDGAGDVDYLRRFSTITLSDASVAISVQPSGATKLTETLSAGGQNILNFSAGGQLLSIQRFNAASQLVGLTYPSQIPHDFTGVLRSDVLFGSGSGSATLTSWQLNDVTITGGGNLGNPGPAWTYEGDGDFYGNGYSDILWRNQNGQLVIWEMQGTKVIGGGSIGNPGGTFAVVGVGDFYGNGNSDILFEDATGKYVIWEMNGTAIVGGGTIGNPGAAFRLVGIGDFNGDGKSDLLFQDTSGKYALWNLNGTSITGGGNLGSPGVGWVYKGIGNFTGLGDSDILFENVNTGQYATWDLTNDKITGGGTLGNPGSLSTLEAIGDYSNTGRSSLLFKNTSTGALASWDLTDTAITGGGTLGNPGLNFPVVDRAPALEFAPSPAIVFVNASGALAEWDINNDALSGTGVLGSAAGFTALSVGDFNGDGLTDVLFSKAGAYTIWETNGKAVIGGGSLGSPGGTYAYKGVGDFNGDGRSDILFQDASGSYATWDLNGAHNIGGGVLGNPGAGLTYIGAGDFTGDGTSDLLLQDASGNFWITFVSQNKIIGTTEIGVSGAGYTLAGIGDLNGDGKADLLLSKAGALSNWDLNGANVVGGGAIGSAPSGWTVAGIGNFGLADHSAIAFDNSATGQVATWLMNDNKIIGGATLGGASGYSILGVT